MAGSRPDPKEQGDPKSGAPGGDSPAGRLLPVPHPIVSPPRTGVRQRALQLLYDAAIGAVWLTLLPVFLLGGLLRPRMARKALSLSTVGLPQLPPAAADRPRVLVHGVSVGEIKASQSIVAELRDRYEVVVSAFSDTGLQVASQLYDGLEIVRYPFDFLPLVRRFWRRVRPDYVLLLELEAWPCFLREANRRGAPVAVISGRITPQSFRRYRMFGSLPEFRRISLFASQDQAYAARFSALAGNPERVVVTGNVKVDGLRLQAEERPADDEPLRNLERIAGLLDAEPRPFVIVAGSTHEPEEVAFVRAALAAVPDARLIVVPRHPERSAGVVTSLAALLPVECAPERLSQLRASGRTGSHRRPLVIDTIGELERVYGLADVVFVGGSLVAHGGQNMMEPAAQGRPVIYGPNIQNFLQETALLEEAGATRRVEDESALASAFGELYRDVPLRRRMGQAGREAIARQRGATRATLVALRERIGLR